MKTKGIIGKYINNFKRTWQEGTLQKSFRITYDVIWNIVLFFIILGIIGLFFAGGVGAGYFASLVKDMPVRSYESMEKDVYNYEETSELYFASNKYMGNIRSDLYREEVTLDQVSDYVKNALIATEDVYFESHNGIVPKAILRAIYQEATNAAMKSGGSTLTQQLIKNQILTNEVSFERKAKEILLAMRLEQTFNKDEILEAYLNVVPFGRNAAGDNVAGIQTAANGIFNVDAKDLNLAQAAFLAGLPQSPSFYTPFTNSGSLKSEKGLQPGLRRMKTVLNRMLEAEYITPSEYEEAVNYNIVKDFAEPMPSTLEKYPYLTNEAERRVIDILSLKLAKEDGYTEDDFETNGDIQKEYESLAERALRSEGYKVHTTINKEVYEKWQEIAAEYDNYGPDKPKTVIDPETGKEKEVTKTNKKTGEEEVVMEAVQASSMLIENKTGKIVSFVGGRNYEDSQVNHATSTLRQNGSTMKPLLVYGPAIEAGVIQPGSVILDAPLPEKYPTLNGWMPKNYTGNYHGLVSAREALKQSYNVPATKIYAEIKNSDPVKHYLEKVGFTSLSDDKRNSDYTNASMAIGSMAYGVTMEENLNAYTTFANEGKFIDAYMIEKIETPDGEIIYKHEKPEPMKVFTPQTAYLTLDMMRDVLSDGTASYAQSLLKNSRVDWAGKTGTTTNWNDHWFVATNPNVTMGTWIGYDTPKTLQCDWQYPCNTSYNQRNLGLWTQLVNAATEIKPDLMAPTEKFKEPKGIVERSYCATSGMKPSDLCKRAGLVRSDIYNEKHVPNKVDDSLTRGSFVRVNGKTVAAGKNTPEEFINGNGGFVFNPEWLNRNMYNKLDNLSLLYPRHRSGGWKKVAIPSTLSVREVKNDEEKPDTPENLEADGRTLSWNASKSSDVMGYRIYRAPKPGQSFALIESIPDTNYRTSDKNAIYQVKAVDYFGQESEASNFVQVGMVSQPEENSPLENNNQGSQGSSQPEQVADQQARQTDEESNATEDSAASVENTASSPEEQVETENPNNELNQEEA